MVRESCRGCDFHSRSTANRFNLKLSDSGDCLHNDFFSERVSLQTLGRLKNSAAEFSGERYSLADVCGE
jgi:hypothetical protein